MGSRQLMMKFNIPQFLLGLLLGMLVPPLIGAGVAVAQGVQFGNFIWAITHMEWYYNSMFQLGIATNIGLFFLLIRKDEWLYFNRGWMIASIACTLWAVFIEVQRF